MNIRIKILLASICTLILPGCATNLTYAPVFDFDQNFAGRMIVEDDSSRVEFSSGHNQKSYGIANLEIAGALRPSQFGLLNKARDPWRLFGSFSFHGLYLGAGYHFSTKPSLGFAAFGGSRGGGVSLAQQIPFSGFLRKILINYTLVYETEALYVDGVQENGTVQKPADAPRADIHYRSLRFELPIVFSIFDNFHVGVAPYKRLRTYSSKYSDVTIDNKNLDTYSISHSYALGIRYFLGLNVNF